MFEFRGIIPSRKHNKTPLFQLILQRLQYYLMGCCTVWILSTRHAKNNVSRSPLWRLHWTRLSPKFISFPKCNASFFPPPCFLQPSSGSRLNYQLTGSGSFLFLIPQEKTSCAWQVSLKKMKEVQDVKMYSTLYMCLYFITIHTWDSNELQIVNPECTHCLYFLF